MNRRSISPTDDVVVVEEKNYWGYRLDSTEADGAVGCVLTLSICIPVLKKIPGFTDRFSGMEWVSIFVVEFAAGSKNPRILRNDTCYEMEVLLALIRAGHISPIGMESDRTVIRLVFRNVIDVYNLQMFAHIYCTKGYSSDIRIKPKMENLLFENTPNSKEWKELGVYEEKKVNTSSWLLDYCAGKKNLRITYVGMEPIEITARPNMRIILTNDQKALDEVIVVGYGTQRREAKTGSITTVSGDEIADIPAISVDKMLAGKLAGVMITQNSGQPGSASSIRIRGTSSINAGNNPLYVVDGLPISTGDDSYLGNESTGNPLSTLNPNDIESITVLKDAAAASVYGSRAANGVILITTKSGKEGKSQFTARARFGLSYLANDNNFGVMNGQELLELQRQAIINAGKNPDDPTAGANYYRPYELLTRPQTNWMDNFTRTGKMQEYEITMSGGSAKTKYYNSVSYNKTDGVFYGFDFSRLIARVNVDHEINKWLKTGVRVSGGYRKSNDVPTQSLYYANPAWAGLTILPWSKAYNEDGSHYVPISENSNQNPRATAQYDEQWDQKYDIKGSFYLEYKPIKQLTFKTTNGVDLTFGESRRYWSLEAHNNATGYPRLQQGQTTYRTLTTSNTATYQDVFNEKHNLRVLAGQEATAWKYIENYQRIGNINPDIPYLTSGTFDADDWFGADYGRSKETMMSWFGILDYSYDSRYYLQASIRADGSSLFGENNRWGTFWSLGLSWNAHNEKFMKDVKWLDVLKLRASYGVNGNNNITVYQAYGTYSTAIYNGLTGMIPSTPANPDLSWERNKAWNFGIDFRFLKRFSGSLDIYTRKTTDMLLDKAQSSTSGFNTALTNVGSMRNSGIEFQFDANIIDSKDWKWDVGFNISHNKSKRLSQNAC